MASYAIEKDGELIRHVVSSKLSKTWKTNHSVEILLFDNKKTAAEVSVVLNGKVIEFDG